MRLALLGADADTPGLVAALARRPQDQLVAVCECQASPLAAALARRGQKTLQIENWEELLDRDFVDAVIVAYSADEDRRADQLRKFAQASMPVLAAHPLFAAMIVYYELDMICRDTQAVFLPCLAQRQHPAIVELARLCQPAAGGPLGAVEQLICERHLADRGKAAVRRQFARDVDLLRAIGGDMTRIHAMGPTLDSASNANLTVQMSGATSLLVRWSVAPPDEQVGGRLTLVGSAGRAVVTIPSEPSAAGASGTAGAPIKPWGFELSVAGNRLERPLGADWDPAAAALDALAEATGGAAVKPDWVDAARSAELAESIDRSLKRGRTVELYNEEYSEASTFKGLMAAIGCCLLVVGLFVVVVVGVLEDFLRRHVPLVPKWPYVLLGVLGLFLALQLLLLALVRRPALGKRAAAGPADPGDDPSD